MDKNKHLEDIKDIKKMMDKATRFSSLSGISIVIAGLLAAFGGFLIKININIINQNNKRILQPVTKAYKKSIDIIY